MQNKLFYFILVLIASGCTIVRVTKVKEANKNTVKGIRYALGKPFIKATPSSNGDGTYTVEVVYLPDEDQIYAVDARTYFAKSEMEIAVDESGILKKIDWKGTSDATASEVAKAAGNIAKADLENTKKENDEKEKEYKDKKKAAEEAVKALQTSLDQKNIDKAVAENDKVLLGPPSNDATKEKIRLLDSLIFKLDAEIKALENKIKIATATASSFNNPESKKEMNAYGPVLYRITETSGRNPTLKLEAVSTLTDIKQLQFATVSKAEQPAASAASVPVPKQSVYGPVDYAVDGTASIVVEFKDPITKINETISAVSPAQYSFSKIAVSSADNKSYTLKFNKTDFPAGEYILTLSYSYRDEAGELQDATKSLNVKLK
ncbi:hypothetical protein [Flavobacterium piscis]|uniref:DUF4831 family protein n=1 Tax=Flavobacterium piscis TaxID=1114874 RepID=A0ABU1Y3L7_9FLAO|nr:hypothetical protein [Flavobacterium piscis]MDR7208821.1 hypothetical protein [Flavobacterium piscis]